MAPHSEPDDGILGIAYDDHNGFSDEAPIIDIPVLIVGGGPSGLLQAYLLSQLGGVHISLPSLLITKLKFRIQSGPS